MKAKFEVGQLCSVNAIDEGQVYVIDSISNGEANLSYYSGQTRMSGGSMDLSLLKVPTKAQLAHEFNEITVESVKS